MTTRERKQAQRLFAAIGDAAAALAELAAENDHRATPRRRLYQLAGLAAQRRVAAFPFAVT